LRIRLQPWAFFVLLAAIVAFIAFSIERYRHGSVLSDADMVAFLPQTNATTFFIDIAAMRQARALNLLTASAPAEENDYREFIQETGFDYTKDADAIAGAAANGQIFFLMRGRFDWRKLAGYTTRHGGFCRSSYCRLPTTRPGRWASFRTNHSGVIALAVSTNPEAVLSLAPANPNHQKPIPTDPVWVKPAHSLLSDPSSLPLPARLLAISLQFSDRVTLSLGRGGSNTAPFEVKLQARYPTAPMARTTCTQLEIDTRMLKLELARERQQPNPADLTGLLASGEFQVKGNEVLGAWPIRQELLNSLQ